MNGSDRFHDYVQDVPMKLGAKFFPPPNIELPSFNIPHLTNAAKFQYNFEAEHRARRQFEESKRETLVPEVSENAKSLPAVKASPSLKAQKMEWSQGILLPHPVVEAPSKLTVMESPSLLEFEALSKNVFDDLELSALDDRAALHEVLMNTKLADQPSSNSAAPAPPPIPERPSLLRNNSNQAPNKEDLPPKRSKEEELKCRLLEKGFRMDIVELCIAKLPRSRLVHVEYYIKGVRTMEKNNIPVNEGFNFLLSSNLTEKQAILKYADSAAKISAMGFASDSVFASVQQEDGDHFKSLNRVLASNS